MLFNSVFVIENSLDFRYLTIVIVVTVYYLVVYVNSFSIKFLFRFCLILASSYNFIFL